MMAYDSRHLLFYVDGERLSRNFDWTWIDKWCGIYGLHPVIIDPNNYHREAQQPPYYFKNIEEAVTHPDLETLEWVWLSERAEVTWDEVSMPQNNVVYCIGSDANGFYGYVGEGQHVRLVPPHPGHESGPDSPWYAAMVVPLLLFRVYGITGIKP